MLCLRQEVEDPAAVVITDHERGADAMALQRPQAVHVVIEREVAKQQYRRRRIAAGGDTEAAGDQPVDPTRSPVGIEPLLRAGESPEAVGGSDRHARSDEDLSWVGQTRAQSPDHVTLVKR